MSTKAVFKDVGRALGIDHTIINDMNKLIPVVQGKALSIDDSLEEVMQLKQYEEHYPEMFKLARQIENMPRSSSIHACFDADTLVTTKVGLKRIADIHVDDEVLTHNNRFKPVGEVMTTEAESTYILKANSAFPVEVTGNHPMFVREMSYRRLRKYKGDLVESQVKEFSEPKWKAVEELTVGSDYLGIAINQESTLPDLPYKLPYNNENFWWLIGRYLGDGWTESYQRTENYTEKRIIICCSKNDNEYYEIYEKLNLLGFEHRMEEARTTCKFHIKVDGLYDYLQLLGRYAHGKYIPGHILNLPKYLLSYVLDGYFSADGHRRDNLQSFKTVSKELAIGLMACVNKVYQRHCGISILPEKEEFIEGRKVSSKEKYNVVFTYKPASKEQSFYEDGYIWTRLASLKHVNEPKTMYNISVYDDNSYTVHNLIAHNCGVLITPEPISKSAPLMRGKEGETVTQYDGPTLESLGFIKFDFLGLKNLSVLSIWRKLVLERHGKDINPDELEPDDPKVFETIRNGNTDGLFQIESPGGENACPFSE